MTKCSCSRYSASHSVPEGTITDFRINLKWLPQNWCDANSTLKISVYNGTKSDSFQASLEDLETELIDAIEDADYSTYKEIQKMHKSSLCVTRSITGLTIFCLLVNLLLGFEITTFLLSFSFILIAMIWPLRIFIKGIYGQINEWLVESVLPNLEDTLIKSMWKKEHPDVTFSIIGPIETRGTQIVGGGIWIIVRISLGECQLIGPEIDSLFYTSFNSQDLEKQDLEDKTRQTEPVELNAIPVQIIIANEQ